MPTIKNDEDGIVEKDADRGRPICGIVRPIAGIEAYPEGHWLEVHQTITEAAEIAGYDAKLVSDDEAIGVILGRIVTNLHDLPIVVIDVSGLNPNVFFELGMRLTFDKPTVVIKDDLTRYPFDASPIEYIPYPSSLRHSPLISFKAKLATAIRKTADAVDSPSYRSFLKHFGSVQPGGLGEDQTLASSLILDEIRSLKGMVRKQNNSSISLKSPNLFKVGRPTIRAHVITNMSGHILHLLEEYFGKNEVALVSVTDDSAVFDIAYSPTMYSPENLRATIRSILAIHGVEPEFI